MTIEATEFKSLLTRVESAEQKVKTLEDEKKSWLEQSGYKTPVVGGSSLEKKALSFFGVSHAKQLLKVNTEAPRFAKVPAEIKHLVKEFKTAVDTSRWISQMFHGESFDTLGRKEDESDNLRSVKGTLDHYYGRNVLAPMIKAFGSTVVGGGDEWVPTAVAASYIDEYELDKVLEQRFRSVPMPTNPFEQPVKTGVTKARKATENTAITDSNFSTTKISFSATKLAEYYILPDELTEDSAPDFMAAGREEVVRAQIRAVEAAMINGDDDGTHIDSDTQAAAADVAEKIWKGLRRQALANSANGSTVNFGAAFTKTLLRQLRAAMGIFGSNPRELLWIVGPSVYTQFLALDDVSTIDKFGPQATVLQGALAAYQGIPIVESQYMREDLSATGVYDGVTTTLGGILLVNATRWYVGQRSPIKVKMMPDLPNQDRMLLASYQRKDFKGHTQSATEKSVVYGYNVLK
jgi:HK97 family phage major capsid protein